MGGGVIAAAALKPPTRNGYNAQGVNLKFILARVWFCGDFWDLIC